MMRPNELLAIVAAAAKAWHLPGRMQLIDFVQFVQRQMAGLKKRTGRSVEPAEGLHELRLSIKHLRAFCQLLRPLEPELAAQLIIQLKSIARSVSSVRDHQVIMAWLKAHPEASRGVSAPRPKRVMRSRLETARGEVLALQNRLKKLARACQKNITRPHVTRHYLRALNAWRLAIKTESPADLHRARRRLKDLQYQLEILEGTPHLALNHNPRKFRRRLQQVTTALGEAHDGRIVESYFSGQGLPAAKITRIRKECVKSEQTALQVAKKLHLLRDLRPEV